MTLAVYPDRLRRDIAAAVQNAATGGKRAAGYTVVAARFPAGSTLRLIRASGGVATTVFQCTTTAQPMVVDGRLRLSKVYGAATVLANADKDTGTWTWTLTNGNNRISGALGPYALTGDLSTSKGLSIGDVYLTIDPALDPTSGTGNILPASDPSLSLPQGWVRSMTMADQGQSKNFNSASWTHQPGQIQIGSAAGLAYLTQQGGGDIMTHGTGLDGLTCWNWADADAAHVSAGNELQHRGNQALVLKANNTWEMMWSAPLGTGYAWTSSSTTTGVGTVDRSSLGAGIRAYSSNLGNQAHEIWPEDFIPVVNAGLMQQAKCWHVRSLFRVGRTGSGPDNRAQARYRVKLGFDVFNTSHPNFAGRGSQETGNPFRRPEPMGGKPGTMPGYAMDGGGCSWHIVPFNPANPDAWYSIAVTSFTPAFYEAAGMLAAVAAAMGVPLYTPNPAGLAPYAIAQAAFLANPPPVPV